MGIPAIPGNARVLNSLPLWLASPIFGCRRYDGFSPLSTSHFLAWLVASRSPLNDAGLLVLEPISSRGTCS